MRQIKLLAALVFLAAAAVAYASSQASVGFFRKQQGATLAVAYRSLAAATSACVIAPTGTTCTGGQNYASGALRSVIVQNVGSGDAFCDETSPAVASQGFLLTGGGGSITLDTSVLSVALYCISTPGTTVALVQEKS